MQNLKRYQVVVFQSETHLFFLETRTLKQRRNVLGSKRGFKLKKVIHSPTNIHFFDMEQFVLVPVPVQNNKYVNTQSDKMQEVPKIDTEQNSTYQIDSLEKEVDRKLFNKADLLVDSFLTCPRIKIPSSLTLVTDGVETEVLLSVFAQHLHRKNTDGPEVHYILLDAAGKSKSGYESGDKNQSEGKLGTFQNLSGRNSKGCKLKVLLLMNLCEIYGRLAICQC